MKTKSAADLGVRGAGAFCRDVATVSRCSCRHAADPLLTNKDGKQEAKDDDDEREAEQHEIPRSREMERRSERCAANLDRLTRRPAALSRGTTPLDIFTRVHNNTVMNAARALPAAILVNLARSSGATG